VWNPRWNHCEILGEIQWNPCEILGEIDRKVWWNPRKSLGWVVDGRICSRFRSIPEGYCEIPLLIQQDMSVSVLFPVSGNIRMVTVPVRWNSGGNTASIFRIFFRPVPLQSGLETAGISGNKQRFLQDPAGSGCGKHRPGLLPSIFAFYKSSSRILRQHSWHCSSIYIHTEFCLEF